MARDAGVMLSSLVLQIAAEVIAKSSRDNPADAALREALKSRRLPSSDQQREISRAVFSYFRWFGWLDRAHPLSGQIKNALQLAQAFKERPEIVPYVGCQGGLNLYTMGGTMNPTFPVGGQAGLLWFFSRDIALNCNAMANYTFNSLRPWSFNTTVGIRFTIPSK